MPCPQRNPIYFGMISPVVHSVRNSMLIASVAKQAFIVAFFSAYRRLLAPALLELIIMLRMYRMNNRYIGLLMMDLVLTVWEIFN